MAQSHLHQSVLAAKPAANCDSYIDGLLTELREKTDTLPIVPGQQVKVDYAKIMDLRGVVSELILAVRNDLKWARI